MKRSYFLAAIASTVTLLLIACGGRGTSISASQDANLIGKHASKSIPVTGGTISLPNLLSVDFPQGVGGAEQKVQLQTLDSKTTKQDFSATYPEPRAELVISDYVIHINIGLASLESQTATASLTISPGLLAKAGTAQNVRVYYRNKYASEDEDSDDFLDVAEASFPNDHTLVFQIPTWAFSSAFTTDGTREAQILLYVISPTQGGNQTGPPRDTDACGGISLDSVLGRPITTSEYGSPFGTRQIEGRTQFHNGLDIKVVTGTPVYAAFDGRIEVYPEAQNPKPGGGNQINLAFAKGADGYAIKYLHLDHFAPGVTTGQIVHTGDLLGYSGSTGHSLGPHLHLSISRGSTFIDPKSCGSSTSGGTSFVYTGLHFDHLNGATPLTTENCLSLRLTFSGPLPPSTTLYYPASDSSAGPSLTLWSCTDGVDTWTNASDTGSFQISTDGNGNVISGTWGVVRYVEGTDVSEAFSGPFWDMVYDHVAGWQVYCAVGGSWAKG